MGGTILDMSRALMITCGLPHCFWGEANVTACYIHDRLPLKYRNNKSALEMLEGKAPPTKHMRVFGCNAFVMLGEKEKSKLQSRVVPGIFIGYSEQQNAYQVYTPTTNQVRVSQNVKFAENDFSIAATLGKVKYSNLHQPQLPTVVCNDSDSDDEESTTSLEHENDGTTISGQENVDINVPTLGDGHESNSPSVQSDTHIESESIDQPSSGTVEQNQEMQENKNEESMPTVVEVSDDNETGEPVPASPQHVEFDNDTSNDDDLRDSDGNTEYKGKGAGGYLDQRQLKQTRQLQLLEQPRPRTRSQTTKNVGDTPYQTRSNRKSVHPDRLINQIKGQPRNNYATTWLTKEQARAQGYINLCAVLVASEQLLYRDIMKSPDKSVWVQAMTEEIQALQEKKVFERVDVPPGVKPIGCRWVYKIKLDSNNKPLRWKARLVVKGYLQKHGVDYDDTFAPVVKIKSLKMLLALAAQFDLELEQLDFDTAFLNADLDEEVYVELPEGFQQPPPNESKHHETNNTNKNRKQCWRLWKALYGLKQAPNKWFGTLDTVLRQLKYKPLAADQCVYVKQSKNDKLIIVCLYVDDTIAAFFAIDRDE
jgi:hypothetical protein